MVFTFFFFFFTYEKNDNVQSEANEVCEFRAKIHPFYMCLQLTAPFAALMSSLSTR